MLTRRPDRDGARWELEESLRRLGCDQLDLHQAHGVTGHDLGAPRAHLAAVKRYDLDTVMFPLYPRVWADPVYRADAEALLSYCAERFEPMTDEDRESVIRITSEDELIFPLAEKLRRD